MPLLDEWTLSLLTNKQLLNLLNGDFISKQVYRDTDKCVWCSVNPKTQESYVALFNLTNEKQSVEAMLEECAAMYMDGVFPMEASNMVEIWSGEAVEAHAKSVKSELAPHGAKLYYRF